MHTSNRIALLISFLFLISCRAHLDDLKIQNNLLNAINISVQEHKPLFIHITGFGSYGNNEFKDEFARNKTIQKILNENYITVELYVDDKTMLTSTDTININKIISSEDGKKRISKSRTVGNINNAIEIELLHKNTQPQYIITDSSAKIILENFEYLNRNKKTFIQKLKKELIHLKN